jgi:hypothetical protein
VMGADAALVETVAHTQAVSFQGLARSGLTDLRAPRCVSCIRIASLDGLHRCPVKPMTNAVRLARDRRSIVHFP